MLHTIETELEELTKRLAEKLGYTPENDYSMFVFRHNNGRFYVKIQNESQTREYYTFTVGHQNLFTAMELKMYLSGALEFSYPEDIAKQIENNKRYI